MLCYRDKTFCVSENCTNECRRQLVEEDRKEADRLGLPISVAEYCDKGNHND
jgi:hypothetical protein